LTWPNFQKKESKKKKEKEEKQNPAQSSENQAMKFAPNLESQQPSR
jgi:hypothetical protein